MVDISSIYKFTKKTQLICIVMSAIILFIFWPVYWNSFIALRYSAITYFPTNINLLNIYIYVITTMLFVIVIHEGIHGIIFILYGGKIKFGIQGLYVYIQESSGLKMSKNQFLIILLAPVTIISLISIIIPGYTGGFVFLLNLMSSTVDIYMAFILVGIKSNCKIKDSKFGFEIDY